jgi:hypothetical protein
MDSVTIQYYDENGDFLSENEIYIGENVNYAKFQVNKNALLLVGFTSYYLKKFHIQ